VSAASEQPEEQSTREQSTITFGAFIAAGAFFYAWLGFFFGGSGNGSEAFYSAASTAAAGLFVAVVLAGIAVASPATSADATSRAGLTVGIAAAYVGVGLIFSLIAVNNCHGVLTTSRCGGHLDFSFTWAGIAGGIGALIGAGGFALNINLNG
jgi:hypothetical protein